MQHNTRTHTHKHTLAHTLTHTQTQTHTHTYTHTLTHSLTYTLTHTHSLTHTQHIIHTIHTQLKLFYLGTKGQKARLIGHLVKGMVVVFKQDIIHPVHIGIVSLIWDSVTPRPHFQIDIPVGTFENPRFNHSYSTQIFVSAIDKV